MHARVRTYQIKQGQIDERLKHAQETSVPGFKSQEGYAGTIILVDPVSHKNMTVGLWESEAAMHASERDERVVGQSGHHRHAAGDVTTEHYEVKERAGGIGRFARARTYQIKPGQIEARLQHARSVAAPYYQAQPEYRGHMVLVDEANHKTITLSFYETEADLLTHERKGREQASLSNPPHMAGADTVEHFQVGHAQ
jgi:hypothetical protein